MLSSIVYILLCLIVPIAWGLLVYWVSSAVERAVTRSAPQSDSGEKRTIDLDYHI